MQKITHQQLLDWLKKEVKLSLVCTEPIAIAYAAAVAAKYLNAPILKITGIYRRICIKMRWESLFREQAIAESLLRRQ